ncbi:GNAT family N-acetyltransferase [Catenulispora rubra]|uniref:GNAT family N-acetyltransferase n=1 Tax=Catenulispora rubra TaxID=280293 RepID=UPI0018924917|nr:GNAT family N-acetyltransferase [Catenulispora rubra]
MTSVEISLFDTASATDVDLAESYDVTMSVADDDFPGEPRPTLDQYAQMARRPADFFGPVRRWVAREDGHIVATGSATYPEHENRHGTITRVAVRPDRRRQGIGTALLRVMLPDLRIDGRTVVIGYGLKADAAGEWWARELGFVRTNAFARQVLTIADVDPALWQCPVADGFRLEHWIGSVPEALLAEYARARTAIHDAPQGDSTLAFPDWTPERVRAEEAEMQARRAEVHVIAAVHEAGGRVAGFTELELSAARTDAAFQLDTAVVAEFRGHGLGLAVKGAMLRRLTAERPAIGTVFSSNASDNTHMIRVNHALGFVTRAVMADVELDAAELVKGLAAH